MPSAETTDYFRDLYELGADPSASLDEKVTQAIEVGRDRLGVQHGVLSYTAEGTYEVIESTITSGEYEAGSIRDLETTWCRHVVSNRQLLAISDVTDTEYSTDVAHEETGLQCYIGAPVVVDGEVYGTLCYSSSEPRPTEFDDDERRFVRLLTRWIGYELERERHYRALDAQNERLEEFAGVLAHDIRNPLTAAIGYTELALETAPDPVATHLRTVLDSLDRIETLITDTLSLARDGVDVGEREPVELERIARETWETVSPSNATLEVVDSRTITADDSRLRQLFENVFRNVQDHCGEDVHVTVRGTESGFEIVNDGPEMPESVAGSLFGDSFGADRVGLGLAIVERIVSGHGWQGAIETSPEETAFIFSGIGTASEAPKPDH